MTKLDKHTNIIFLDMDGVINSGDMRDELLQDPELYCPRLVTILNGLNRIPDVKIVLSSTWRFKFDTADKVNTLFKQIGIELGCIGVTPTGGQCRGLEIDRWIKDNVEVDYWIYKRYAIIDDDGDMLLSQADNFFHVDHSVGITENVIYRVCNHFRVWE